MRNLRLILKALFLTFCFLLTSCSNVPQRNETPLPSSNATDQTNRIAGNKIEGRAKPANKLPSVARNLSKNKVLSKLQKSGLTFETIEETRMDLELEQKLPERPKTIFAIRLSDGKGNREPMTLIEFSSSEAAQKFKKKKVNGFPIHNWFFMGTVSNYFKSKIETALK